MAKNSYSDWDTTAGNNTDVGGINIAEGCAAANVNNAMRAMMGQLATADLASMSDTVGRFLGIQTFTSSGTYTPSSGAKTALIRMVGGGGGGGAADSDATGQIGAGEGGASGAFIEGLLDVSGGAYTATITIGAAGTAGTLPTNSGIGVAGGDTVYDDGTVTWTAGGGNGGGCNADVSGRFVTRGPNGGTATSVGATLGYSGRVGGDAHGNASASAPIAKGGGGANSQFGSGGRGGGVQSENNSTAGSPASGYGAGGGGGAAAGTASAVTGGAGTAGFIIIYEYSE